MNFKRVATCILTGDWEGLEVHDKEVLARYIMVACGVVLLIGIGTGIQSCTRKPDVPRHIQTIE